MEGSISDLVFIVFSTAKVAVTVSAFRVLGFEGSGRVRYLI